MTMESVATGMPAQTQRSPGRATRITALVSLYALAVGALWSPPLVQLAQVALVVVLVAQVWRTPGVYVRSPLFWVVCVFVIYVILRGLVAGLIESPHLSDLHFEGIRRWIKAGPLPVLCVAVAFCLVGNRQLHIRRIFLVFALTFTAYLILKLDPARFWAAINPHYTPAYLEHMGNNRRYIFGEHFAFTSLLYALVIVGLLALGTGYCWAHCRDRRRRAVCGMGGAVLLVFFLAALVAGGARTSWLATLGGIGMAAVCLGVYGRSWVIALIRTRAKTTAMAAIVLVLSVGVFAQVFGDAIVERFSRFGDRPVAAVQVLMGERTVESLPTGPVGDRFAYYAFGLERLADRPLFGYGPGRPRHLVFEYEAPYQIDDRNTHLHSQYLDFLLRFGLVGFVLLASLFVFALKGAYRGWSQRRVGGDYALFMIAAVTVYAIWSLSDQRFTNFTMIAVVSLILGSGVSFLLPADGGPSRGNDSARSAAGASTPAATGAA